MLILHVVKPNSYVQHSNLHVEKANLHRQNSVLHVERRRVSVGGLLVAVGEVQDALV